MSKEHLVDYEDDIFSAENEVITGDFKVKTSDAKNSPVMSITSTEEIPGINSSGLKIEQDEADASKHIAFGDVEKDKIEDEYLDKEVEDLRSGRTTRGRGTSMYELDAPRISGDFTVSEPLDIEMAGTQGDFSISDASSEEEEEQMVEETEEEERVSINREECIEEYNKLIDERKALRRKNNYLHKKMAENLRKRNLDAFLKETVPTEGVDLQEKYDRCLKNYDEIINWEKEEQKKLEEQLQVLNEKLAEEKITLETLFEAMLKREKDVSVGLIDSKTGKVISDKEVCRLLKRQQAKMVETGQIRLICIKIRDKVLDIESSLRGVETLGENLHLVDYEQLRMENQNYGDKIEERDDELTKLRNKSTAAIQMLAHYREKSYAIAVDINGEFDKLRDVDSEVSDARERVTHLKIKRDAYRAETQRLQLSSGLLTRTKLLRDFETAIEQVEKTRKQLESVTEAYETQKQELLDIRLALETGDTSVEIIMKPKISKGPRVYRGRPTLTYPELPPKRASSQILRTIFRKS